MVNREGSSETAWGKGENYIYGEIHNFITAQFSRDVLVRRHVYLTPGENFGHKFGRGNVVLKVGLTLAESGSGNLTRKPIQIMIQWRALAAMK